LLGCSKAFSDEGSTSFEFSPLYHATEALFGTTDFTFPDVIAWTSEDDNESESCSNSSSFTSPKRRRLSSSLLPSCRGLVRSKAMQSLVELDPSSSPSTKTTTTLCEEAKQVEIVAGQSLYILQPKDGFQWTTKRVVNNKNRMPLKPSFEEQTLKMTSSLSSTLLQSMSSPMPCLLNSGRQESDLLCPCFKCLLGILNNNTNNHQPKIIND
jgi:hypothetical protein